jgi:predicted porin
MFNRKHSIGISYLGFALFSAHAMAENSVTLFGIVDDGLFYNSSQTSLGSTKNGKSTIQMQAGVWTGSQFGLKGKEDLGGGTAAIFNLDSRFNLNNGASQFTNAAFGQWAYVGLTNPAFGTLTGGRQLTSYYSLLSPYSPTAWLTGFSGAHPGDIDNLDTTYKTSNTLVYTSPAFHGVTVGGSYAVGGQPGSLNAGSSWSAAIQYKAGAGGIAAGIERFNNSANGGGAWGADSTATMGTSQQGVSALTNGYQTAAAQQRFAVTAGYKFASKVDVSVSYSNVQYIAGTHSAFRTTTIWNTLGAVVHYAITPAANVAAGYSYTRASKANGITNGAQYQQASLSQYYSLSKSSGVYAVEALQRSSGQTLGTDGVTLINATPTVGDGYNAAPSSSRTQIVAGAGFIHRF